MDQQLIKRLLEPETLMFERTSLADLAPEHRDGLRRMVLRSRS